MGETFGIDVANCVGNAGRIRIASTQSERGSGSAPCGHRLTCHVPPHNLLKHLPPVSRLPGTYTRLLLTLGPLPHYHFLN